MNMSNKGFTIHDAVKTKQRTINNDEIWTVKTNNGYKKIAFPKNVSKDYVLRLCESNCSSMKDFKKITPKEFTILDILFLYIVSKLKK